ncbi:MAG: fused response regulator/phosphatase [Melioribacteraceae bacterium]|nr:fused response regulator/phosphatase [Melioribacteraceae bacterium]MCF8412564.1 fused response regulator/phosphatase [Melioribacteraceae bacterium]MCF8431031.1 fused response regulator/phosphatase [Melioribacteraceae bacterium]
MQKPIILIVEDEINIAKLFHFVLTRDGFDCVIHKNGQAALDNVEKINPDLILSDIMMPILDGIEFRKELLKNPKTKDIPFVFLTAKGTEDDMIKGYDLKIKDYILKTSSPKIVSRKISSILQDVVREREKFSKEVKTAADKLGLAIAPEEPPELNGFKISHWYQPYKDTPGGDFINYFKLNDHRLFIGLGDVMGKKWGAWYYAVAYAGYVRSAVRMVLQNNKDFSVAEIIQEINEAVFKDDRISDVFMVFSAVIIDTHNMTLSYCGAGDLPIIHKSGTVEFIKSEGLLLGFKEFGNYSNIEIKLKPNDLFLLYTDGLTESRNESGEAFGQGKLKEIVESETDLNNMISTIRKKFSEFNKGKFEDDISLISIYSEPN